MDAPNLTTVDEPRRPGSRILLEAVERTTGPAFLLAGASMLASLVVPVGLSAVTDRAWMSGLALVGLAVPVAFVGVLGMVRRSDDVSWGVRIGAAASGIAAVVAVGWLVALGVLLAGAQPPGRPLPEPMGLFRWSAVAMAGGLALGYLAAGAAHWRGAGPLRRSGRLLAIGGVALLIPVAVALLSPLSGVRTPGWLLLPALLFVALDTLLVGWIRRPRPS